MDPQVATSFIPKEALTQEKARAGGMGLFFLITLLIFIISIVAAGAAVAYQQYLKQQLASNQKQLDIQKGAFDPATIQDLLRMDSRIEQGKLLLQRHLAPSAIFDFLSLKTKQKVQFTSFSYEENSDGSAKITMDGITDSFATIALQSDSLGKATGLKDVIFSNINVDQTGKVAFTVTATVDASMTSYSKQVAAASVPQQ